VAFDNTYLFKSLLYVDMFLCALIWRDADITISSRTGLELRRAKPRVWARSLGWVLNHIQTGHCESAIRSDIARAQAALAILERP
jgi:hypothetical protein